MVDKSQSDSIEAIGKAQSDRRLQHGLVDHLLSIEENLMNSLISEYRSGQLTEYHAIGTVGAFNALRLLQERIEAREQESLAIVEEEHR